MNIAEFLINEGYGKNIHEIKKKFYKQNEIKSFGFEFLVNGKKITDIYYQLQIGDDFRFLLDGLHKYIIK